MFKKLTHIILFLISVFDLTLGQLGFEEPEDTQNHLYPCWTYINCVSEEGGPERQKRDECMAPLQEADIGSGIDNVKKGYYKLETKGFLPLVEEFCSKKGSERKSAFDKITKGLTNYYMVTCSSPGGQDECGRWGDAADCVVALMEELNGQGKCEVSE
ncbi:hypothetical protein NPIL_118351 [Nephila pilipes]|uniref:Uncharacterized protein n=1 Tax=Nephila pilipes TaxID=299642 RepID=A0A8X6P8F0_NEPPI|nr:hypothetical protein NPIL_118351 [Nephila pilipes]